MPLVDPLAAVCDLDAGTGGNMVLPVVVEEDAGAASTLTAEPSFDGDLLGVCFAQCLNFHHLSCRNKPLHWINTQKWHRLPLSLQSPEPSSAEQCFLLDCN